MINANKRAALTEPEQAPPKRHKLLPPDTESELRRTLSAENRVLAKSDEHLKHSTRIGDTLEVDKDLSFTHAAGLSASRLDAVEFQVHTGQTGLRVSTARTGPSLINTSRNAAAISSNPSPRMALEHTVSATDDKNVRFVRRSISGGMRSPFTPTFTRNDDEMSASGSSSSSSRPKLKICSGCRNPHTQSFLNPFISCSGCSRQFHDSCTKPKCQPGEQHRWRCYHCKSKDSASVSSISTSRSNPAQKSNHRKSGARPHLSDTSSDQSTLSEIVVRALSDIPSPQLEVAANTAETQRHPPRKDATSEAQKNLLREGAASVTRPHPPQEDDIQETLLGPLAEKAERWPRPREPSPAVGPPPPIDRGELSAGHFVDQRTSTDGNISTHKIAATKEGSSSSNVLPASDIQVAEKGGNSISEMYHQDKTENGLQIAYGHYQGSNAAVGNSPGAKSPIFPGEASAVMTADDEERGTGRNGSRSQSMWQRKIDGDLRENLTPLGLSLDQLRRRFDDYRRGGGSYFEIPPLTSMGLDDAGTMEASKPDEVPTKPASSTLGVFGPGLTETEKSGSLAGSDINVSRHTSAPAMPHDEERGDSPNASLSAQRPSSEAAPAVSKPAESPARSCGEYQGQTADEASSSSREIGRLPCERILSDISSQNGVKGATYYHLAGLAFLCTGRKYMTPIEATDWILENLSDWMAENTPGKMVYSKLRMGIIAVSCQKKAYFRRAEDPSKGVVFGFSEKGRRDFIQQYGMPLSERAEGTDDEVESNPAVPSQARVDGDEGNPPRPRPSERPLSPQSSLGSKTSSALTYTASKDLLALNASSTISANSETTQTSAMSTAPAQGDDASLADESLFGQDKENPMFFTSTPAPKKANKMGATVDNTTEIDSLSPSDDNPDDVPPEPPVPSIAYRNVRANLRSAAIPERSRPKRGKFKGFCEGLPGIMALLETHPPAAVRPRTPTTAEEEVPVSVEPASGGVDYLSEEDSGSEAGFGDERGPSSKFSERFPPDLYKERSDLSPKWFAPETAQQPKAPGPRISRKAGFQKLLATARRHRTDVHQEREWRPRSKKSPEREGTEFWERMENLPDVSTQDLSVLVPKHYHNIWEALDIPRQPLPWLQDRQLAFRSSEKINGQLPRPKIIYKVGRS